jgi:hypothetical protein
MRTRIWSFPAIALALCFVAGCATPFRDDSHYVRLGRQSGYNFVRPDSPLRDQLHLTYAPTSDTGDPLHRGRGTDVLAFRFNPRGVLSTPPAYICQLRPEGGIVGRLGLLSVGRSRLSDVERLFGRIHTVVPKLDGLLVYYTLPVYNPLEETPSGVR